LFVLIKEGQSPFYRLCWIWSPPAVTKSDPDFLIHRRRYFTMRHPVSLPHKYSATFLKSSMKEPFYPEDGDSKFIWNVDTYLISDTESKRRSPSSIRSTFMPQLLTRKHDMSDRNMSMCLAGPCSYTLGLNSDNPLHKDGSQTRLKL